MPIIVIEAFTGQHFPMAIEGKKFRVEKSSKALCRSFISKEKKRKQFISAVTAK